MKQRDELFNLSRDLLCVAGFDGYFKDLNPAWENTLGFSRADLLAAPFIEFVHPDDRAGTEAAAEKLAAGGEVIHFENRYRGKDGAYHWLSWNARASEAQKLICATARDVTEQKRRVEKIAQLNAELGRHAVQLEEANNELEAFSYSVSHDLWAPLRHIDGFVARLRKSAGAALSETDRRYLKIIADSAKQMGNLIDDLLVFSRMGRTGMHETELDLETLARQVIAGFHEELQHRNIIFKNSHLPKVHGDPAMLRQVLANLISNAVKYTRPREQAVIELGCSETPDGFVISVRDNGVGFDAEYAHKLFGVFQRLHRSDEFEGTGIGLANVRRVINRHRGRTWAEGKVNGGATFYFSLPKRT